MSKTVSSLLIGLVNVFTSQMKPKRRVNARSMVSEGLIQKFTMPVSSGEIHFEASTARASHDALSITHGEPETVRWIEDLPAEGVLWDIGANIGVYSLYAAYQKNLDVLAFEPGAASHAALVRNIEINGLDEKIDPFCLAFSDHTSIDQLYMANTGAGHSMHAFGQSNSVSGEIISKFRQTVTGYSMDDFCRIFEPKLPDFIKLDVDSIEDKIIDGASNTLSKHVQSLIVEIDECHGPVVDSRIAGMLKNLGFHIRESIDFSLRNVVFDK